MATFREIASRYAYRIFALYQNLFAFLVVFYLDFLGSDFGSDCTISCSLLTFNFFKLGVLI